MSNNNTTVKQVYVCDGFDQTFAIPFFFLEGEEDTIKVFLIDDATQVATPLVIITDYTLNVPATEVTTVLAYPAGKSILIKRVSEMTQLSEFVQGPFPFEAVEEQFDRVVSLIQEVDAAQASQVSLPDGSTLENITLPVPEANKLIGWNASSDGLENKDALDVASLQAEIDAVEVILADLSPRMDAVEVVNGLQSVDITNLQAEDILIDARMDLIEANYTSLGATVANFPAEITNLQGQLDLLVDRGADVDQLLIDVAAHESRLDVIEPILVDHSTRINQLEAASPISFFSGSQTLQNNQAVALDITDMIRDADGTQLAEITLQVERRTDSEKRYARISLLLQYVEEDALWYVARVNTVVVAGEPDGVEFTVETEPVDKTGQVQYVSDDMVGANYYGKIKFVGKEIPTGV